VDEEDDGATKGMLVFLRWCLGLIVAGRKRVRNWRKCGGTTSWMVAEGGRSVMVELAFGVTEGLIMAYG